MSQNERDSISERLIFDNIRQVSSRTSDFRRSGYVGSINSCSRFRRLSGQNLIGLLQGALDVDELLSDEEDLNEVDHDLYLKACQQRAMIEASIKRQVDTSKSGNEKPNKDQDVDFRRGVNITASDNMEHIIIQLSKSKRRNCKPMTKPTMLIEHSAKKLKTESKPGKETNVKITSLYSRKRILLFTILMFLASALFLALFVEMNKSGMAPQ